MVVVSGLRSLCNQILSTLSLSLERESYIERELSLERESRIIPCLWSVVSRRLCGRITSPSAAGSDMGELALSFSLLDPFTKIAKHCYADGTERFAQYGPKSIELNSSYRIIK